MAIAHQSAPAVEAPTIYSSLGNAGCSFFAPPLFRLSFLVFLFFCLYCRPGLASFTLIQTSIVCPSESRSVTDSKPVAIMSFANVPKRSSGLDFSDGKVPALEQHPDVSNYAPGSHLQRNKTERRRLQGLQRSNTNSIVKVEPYKPQTLMERWQLWMINEGGRRMFFFVWVFLHILVLAFGTLHYDLKDNLVGARATFGSTFGACTIVFDAWKLLNQIACQSLRVPQRWFCMSMSFSSSCPSAVTSFPSFGARL